MPQTRRGDQVDDLHGHRVADPYRWLEDPDSAETRDWVARQNAWTEQHLAQMPARAWFTDTMTQVVFQPRAGVPKRHGGHWFVSRNDGSQDQDVWYMADSLTELEAGGEVIIDPSSFSAEGADSVAFLTVSDNGRWLTYGISRGGSDWTEFVLVDLTTRTIVADEPQVRGKFTVATWLDDDSYLYQDFPEVAGADGTDTAALGHAQLRRHVLGQPQSQDEVILELPGEPATSFYCTVSHDRAWLVVHLFVGTEQQNRVWVLPISGTTEATLGEVIKVLDDADAGYEFVRSTGSALVLLTDRDAPHRRLVSISLSTFTRTGDVEFTELIAETDDTIERAEACGDEVIVVRLHDVSPMISRYRLDGAELGAVDVVGGAVTELDGEVDRTAWTIGLSSVTQPQQAYVVEAGIPRPLHLVAPGSFVPPEISISRQHATSADGTRVPYFLITRTDHDHSLPHPTLLYGYGGFNIPVAADYRPIWPGWLAAGGVLAMANLRGGGEYGKQWYEDGRKVNKQHVFDDFIAVGDHLVSTGVTGHDQLAIFGRSNGGLLVGATMTQRPDLAAVALPGFGVLDLLRFHLFTVGRAWKSDYGDPEIPEDFEVVLGYSPLHNVRPGTAYPATLVTTGDHDDRVVPLHSHKFTAAVQAAQVGDAPILTRVEIATGHGHGKPQGKVAAEFADGLAFAAHHTGLQVPGSQ
ncbi:MAG: prolyl oligopeptidase family serine peptidase [Propionibacteriales bacterium]|nr:prolyl oligopeptidase family serine peptidase [Propionibacteriales bacterium]